MIEKLQLITILKLIVSPAFQFVLAHEVHSIAVGMEAFDELHRSIFDSIRFCYTSLDSFPLKQFVEATNNYSDTSKGCLRDDPEAELDLMSCIEWHMAPCFVFWNVRHFGTIVW